MSAKKIRSVREDIMAGRTKTTKQVDISRLELYDNTRISDFQTCALLFYWRHERDFAIDQPDTWLVFGSAWHAAMDTVWKLMPNSKRSHDTIVDSAMDSFLEAWNERGLGRFSDDPVRTPGTATEMLYSYCIERERLLRHKTFRVVDIERPFAVPLDPTNPDLFYVGRLDKVFEHEGRTYVMEHKTTTAYSKDGPFRSYFVDSFSPNRQIDGYLYAGNMLYGNKFKAVWVDAALVHKDVHDGFRIIPVEHNLQALDYWLWETRYWIDQITANRRALTEHQHNDYLAAFPRSTKSCIQFGKSCAFLDTCKVTTNATRIKQPPPGMRQEKWQPYDPADLARAFAKK